MALQQNVADILFVRTSYVKKIIEDCSNSEETIKLLRFCCWENPQFSSTVLSELLWQVKQDNGGKSITNFIESETEYAEKSHNKLKNVKYLQSSFH